MPSQRPFSKRQEASCPSQECDDCRQVFASQGQTTMRLFKNALVRRNKSNSTVPNYGAFKAPSTISITSFDSKDLPLSDDSDDMTSPASSPGSRPHSSHGLRKSTSRERRHERHQPRRPTLKQIMADEAEAPWTLAAFTQYAAQNLCLENIQFIQDTRKYTQAYNERDDKSTSLNQAATRRSQQAIHLMELWTSLIATYVIPSSPREINIPGDVRAALAKVPVIDQAPAPEHLKPAVAKVMELIEDSILFSFFNEVLAEEHHLSAENATPDTSSKRRSSPLLDASTVTFGQEAIVRRSKASNLNIHNLSTHQSAQNSPGRSTAYTHTTSSSVSNSVMGGTYSTSYSSYTAFTDHPDDESGLTSPTTILSPATTMTTMGQTSSPPITPPPSEHDLSARRSSPLNRSESTGWQKFNKLFKKNSHSSGLKKASRGSESVIEEE